MNTSYSCNDLSTTFVAPWTPYEEDEESVERRDPPPAPTIQETNPKYSSKPPFSPSLRRKIEEKRLSTLHPPHPSDPVRCIKAPGLQIPPSSPLSFARINFHSPAHALSEAIEQIRVLKLVNDMSRLSKALPQKFDTKLNTLTTDLSKNIYSLRLKQTRYRYDTPTVVSADLRKWVEITYELDHLLPRGNFQGAQDAREQLRCIRDIFNHQIFKAPIR